MSNSPTGSPQGAVKRPTDPVVDEARRAVDEVTSEAKNIAKDAKDKVAEMADDATQQAKSFAEENKSRIAEQATAFSGALDKAAEELERSDQAMVAGYARDVARGIENMSVALRERGVDDLLQTVQEFARKQPAAFLGAAALAGFAASRFAKASASRPAGKSPDYAGQDSMVASSPQYPDGFGDDAAGWRGTGDFPQTERGH